MSGGPSLLDVSLGAIREERPVVSVRGVDLIGVVGSVARGEHRPDSDVDIVYEIRGRASLLAVARALIDLQERIGRKVDLVDLTRVHHDLRIEFERDLVRA